MGNWLTAVSLTLTQLNSLISWEFGAHRNDCRQIFTTLPQILLHSRSLAACSPEVCPVTWAVFWGILNTGHLLSSDRKQLICTELFKEAKGAFTEEQQILNLQQIICQTDSHEWREGKEVQVLLLWSKCIVRTMLQLATVTQVLGRNKSSSLKLVSHTSLNRRMQLQRGGERVKLRTDSIGNYCHYSPLH